MSTFSDAVALALVITALAPAVATAADSDPVVWHQSFQKSKKFHRVAIISYSGALALQTITLGTDSAALAYTAGTLETVAGPMVLASSLRSNRALRELGVSVPRTLGSVGWALYGGGAALMLGSAFADDFWMNLGGWTIMSTGVILGGFQQLRNEKHYRAAGFGTEPEASRQPLARRKVRVMLSPQVTTKRAALALTGSW